MWKPSKPLLTVSTAALISLGLPSAIVLGQSTTTDTVVTATVAIIVSSQAQPVIGATARSGSIVAVTDSAGRATLQLTVGSERIVISKLGFVPDTLSVLLEARDTSIDVQLVPIVTRLAEVIVGASRVERRVQDEPERVEVLAGEDVDEKSVMRPADPTTLVSEMPGVRTQITSPVGGAGVRLQGLRGRYTLLLADGLPLYGSSSEGLAFLQIPPLDLGQAEVIKGAATALYGPSAAGGVLNLVSRRPPRGGKRVDEMLLNQTSHKATDVMGWSGAPLSRTWGYTLLGGFHRQSLTDPDNDVWPEMPEFTRFEIRPRAYWTSPGGSTAMVTAGTADEDRKSNMASVFTNPPMFRLSARTKRGDGGTSIKLVRSNGSTVSIRSSVNAQWQDRQFGDSTESDRRDTGFAEATIGMNGVRSQGLIGGSLQTDGLTSGTLSNATYRFYTGSLFGQETYSPTEKASVSTTARVDHHNRYGTFFSPRVSLLSRFASGWAGRLSGGVGFFAPTPLVEEADVVGLSRVRGFSDLTAERITQASADITRTLGPLELTGTVFGAKLNHAVVVAENIPTPGVLSLSNAPSPTRTRGASFFAVYNQEPIAVTALYTYTRSSEWSPEREMRVESPLTPRHTGGVDIAFEEDEIGTRVGLEAFYTGRQALQDDPYRSFSVPYTTIGILLEQRIGSGTIFLNGENLTAVRQTKYERFLLPAPDPTGRFTVSQWAPLEGRTINGGLRFRL